jgi:type VI secretion system protein VasJ
MGKHPVAMDYFQLGVSAPLVNAFGAWIENGYQKVVTPTRNRLALHSWRFWARGIQKGHIACGVARDSSDSTGRPYPLLIMGIGKLPGWEKNWDLLSFLFEEIWSQIEYLASRRFNDLKQLESEISRIQVTAEDWAGCHRYCSQCRVYGRAS